MKSKARRFHPSFVVDLSSATEYYDEMPPSIGNRLRDEVQSRIDLIAENSEAFPRVHNDVRALRLKKFPYVILFRSHPDFVQFVGLVQGNTDRKHWFDRIR